MKPEQIAALQARIAQLETEAANTKLEVAASKQALKAVIEFKVSEKGGVSVYGLGRFPVTLYFEQWQRLIAVLPGLQEFLSANETKLSKKGERKSKPATDAGTRIDMATGKAA